MRKRPISKQDLIDENIEGYLSAYQIIDEVHKRNTTLQSLLREILESGELSGKLARKVRTVLKGEHIKNNDIPF